MDAFFSVAHTKSCPPPGEGSELLLILFCVSCSSPIGKVIVLKSHCAQESFVLARFARKIGILVDNTCCSYNSLPLFVHSC